MIFLLCLLAFNLPFALCCPLRPVRGFVSSRSLRFSAGISRLASSSRYLHSAQSISRLTLLILWSKSWNLFEPARIIGNISMNITDSSFLFNSFYNLHEIIREFILKQISSLFAQLDDLFIFTRIWVLKIPH